jgi:hypothetical protein
MLCSDEQLNPSFNVSAYIDDESRHRWQDIDADAT